MKWYVVHTFSGHEQKVKADIIETLRHEDESLREKIGEIIVPMEPPPPPGEPKKKGGRRKFFPGYILVQLELTEDTHHFIRHRPRCRVLWVMTRDHGRFHSARSMPSSGRWTKVQSSRP